MVVKIIPMVLALLYVVAINMELSAGSQRYEVVRYGEVVEVFPCLDKDAAIVKEMTLQKLVKAQKGNDTVTREKLHIFSKWINCGAFSGWGKRAWMFFFRWKLVKQIQ